ACWKRNAKPTVSNTCRNGSKPKGRKNTRSISKPTTATANAATGIASAHEPDVQITDSATYPPRRKEEPCARLTIRITPKIGDRPLPTRKSSAPYEIPLKTWVSQNCVFIPSPTPLEIAKARRAYLTTAAADQQRRGQTSDTACSASAASVARLGLGASCGGSRASALPLFWAERSAAGDRAAVRRRSAGW